MQIKPKDITIDVDDPFKHDLLNRKAEIENISLIVTNTCTPLIMAIDSPWGTGKTTFIKMWRAYLKSQDVTSIYFNAWESDYAEDPLVVLVAKLDNWLKQLNPKNLTADQRKKANTTWKKANTTWEKAKSHLPIIAKSVAVTGLKTATYDIVNVEKTTQDLNKESNKTANDLINRFNKQSSAIDEFKENVESTISSLNDKLGDNQKNLVMFVDELDRCRPTYAIELLERVKHLFNINRIVFVLSTDFEQLSHSICAVYGNNFNARKYLQRFIDFDYSLKKPENTVYINSLMQSLSMDKYETGYKQEDLVALCNVFATRFSLSLREINLFLTRVRLVLSTQTRVHRTDSFLVISLIIIREHNLALYNRYINDPQIADEVITYFSEGLSSQLLYAKHFGVIQAYLIAANSSDVVKTLLKPYEKRQSDESNHEAGEAAERVIDFVSRCSQANLKENLKRYADIVDLLHQIQVEL